jgi:archaellum component FlaC
MQDIIPAQDGQGNILVGGGGGGGGGGVDRASVEAMEKMMRKMQDLMEGNASQIKMLAETQAKNNERSEQVNKMIEENSAHIKTLRIQNNEQSERMEKMVEENAAQIKTLVETQAQNNERLGRVEEMIEGNAAQIKALAEKHSRNDNSFERMEKLVEENANQIRAVSEGHSANWDHMKVIMQEQRDQLKALADGQSASAEWLQDALEQSTKASSEVTKELKRQRQQNKSQVSFERVPPMENQADCPHDVHPPPRKIDKKVVGYDYGQRKFATGAKEKPAANGK